MIPVSSHAPYDHLSSLPSSPSPQQKEKLGAAQGIILATIGGIIAWTSALAFAFISIR
ncbi:hypothetical protein EDC15_106102 [Acetobacter aceti NBRC 14818]|uniref:hypothetical protein n=1 Tax=Acetobacter aceti TaxID=435 RepID=UPI0002260938|nr:hypothetical protein [Acetobacter aceti]TCS33650.1 hypothetical protein EDC15_106102 [Acetobacter aceti NBRC 14818]